jgi:hypothetical protein
LACDALVVKSEAEGLLKDLVALRVGASTGVEARQFYKKHMRLLFEVSSPCDDDNCSRIFQVQNRRLSALRLEPPAKFNVSVSVKSGTVDSISASLFRHMPIFPTFDASAGMVREYARYPQNMLDRGHYGFPTPVGKPYLAVRLDSQATPEQRRHAFAFSFRCLVKPGWGCDLPCDYLPLAWHDWQVQLRETGFTSFNEYYPKSGRCKP